MNEKSRRVVRVELTPETAWMLRNDLGDLLRDVAAGESDPRVSRRLREVAAAYECGVARLSTTRSTEE